MTPLDPPALTKAMAAGVMTMWLQRLGVDGRAIDRPDLERLCTDIIIAYRDALPQAEVTPEMENAGIAAAEVYALAEQGEAMAGIYRAMHAATLISGVELPGWRLVPVEPTEAMRSAFHSTQNCGLDANGFAVPIWDRQYKAMLEAAPPPPVTGDAP